MTRHSNPEFGRWRSPKDGLASGLILAGLLAVALVGGAIFSASWANAGGGFWGRGHHRGAHSAEEVTDRAGFAAEMILRGLDANDAQQAQVKGIIEASIDTLWPLTVQHRGHREELIAALSGETVDREALEQVRQAELALAEAASLEFVTAIGDIAEVLTPEQRTELLAWAERFRH